MIDVSKYTNLITSEHADKPKFVAMVAALCQPMVDIQNLCEQVPALYDIETAIGVQLDFIGQWVGISRALPEQLTGVYFSFDTPGLGFDQGVWEGPFNPSTYLVFLPDDHYRLLLNARILNNQWDGSTDHAYTIAQTVFNPLGYELIIQDNADLTMSLGIVGVTTAPTALIQAMLTQGVLDIKPATVGIRTYFYPSIPGPIFAFDITNGYFGGFDQSGWATLTSGH